MQNDPTIPNQTDSTRIDNILNSLDNIQPAEPKPFFYTRLMTRISNTTQSSWENFSALITRPSVAFSGIFLIVLMNFMAAWLNFKTPAVAEQPEVVGTEEYTQMATNFYDIENIKP